MDPSSEQPQQMSSQTVEKKPRPNPEEALKCPRCDSTSTKFCYYNNYSLSQPRYFCKSCRRYWTKGGTLRNVPVGGGCRKKRSSSSSSSSLKRDHHDQSFKPNLNPLTTFPQLCYGSNDFTLALARLQKQSCGQLGYNDSEISAPGNPTGSFCDILSNSGMNPYSDHPSFLEAIRSGFLETQSHLQNLYYMYGNGDIGEVDNGNSGGVGISEEMMLPYNQAMSNAASQSVSALLKQEQCGGSEQSERKLLGGSPWQLNADTNIGEIDSGRAIESWNNFTSSWHGLLQSPLM